MKNTTAAVLRGLAALLLPAAMVPAAFAGSLTNAGYGTESTLMGGADIAVARDSFAVNTNPAGLTQLKGKALDLHFSVFDSQGSHTDSRNYRHLQKNQFGAVGDFGYAERVPDTPYAIGINLVVQGGVGWLYKNLNTVFNTRDEATTMFSIIRLAPGFAYKVSDRLSVGAALDINYAAGAQSLFPNTSAAPSVQFPQGFAGVNIKDLSGMSLSAKYGVQYRPMDDDLMLAATYSTKTKLPLKGGIMRVNYTNTIPGAGMVRYDDVEISGFALPAVLAFGVSFRPTKDLLISLQDQYEDTGDAIGSATLSAKNPRSNNPLVPKFISTTTNNGAFGQHVYSIGAAYDWTEQTLLYLGWTYHRRAVPDDNLSATFQPIQQTHVMLGFHHQLGPEWSVDAGLERILHQMVTYNNPLVPFGPSVAKHTGTPMHLQFSRRW